jgi:hypothetical protein
MQKTLITFILVTIPFITASTQSEGNQATNGRKRYFHIEAGYIYPEGTIKESVAIRQNISYYYVNQYSNGYISSTTSGLLLGVRYEYYLPKLKSGISSGLRFTGLNTDISGYTSNNSNFFFLRYSMQDSDTKFARVKSLTENNYLLSIPLEIRFTPFQYKNLSLYAKAGLEYSMISLKNEVNISFQDDDMEVNKDAILENITYPINKNYSTFYSAIGLKLGQEGKTNYTLEVLFPSFFLTKNNFYLVDVAYFEGFRLSIQFPVKNNK